jgi:hypothetical protein
MIDQAAKAAIEGVKATDLGIVGLLVLLIIDKVMFWVQKIIGKRNGQSQRSNFPCKDDPRFQSHVSDASKTKDAVGRMEPVMSSLNTQSIKQTGVLENIDKTLTRIEANGKT